MARRESHESLQPVRRALMIQRLIILFVAFCIVDRCASAQPAPRFDFHVHLLSERLVGHWKSQGMPFSRELAHYTDPDLIIKTLAVERAVAVSMAHLYASTWFERLEGIEESEASWVRAENDFIARCVASRPREWVGMISINPLRDYAQAELERCAKLPGIVGVKLHLPACGVDLANLDHRNALANTLACCAKHRLAILIHLFAGDEPLSHATKFWDLIEPHAELPILVAHFGASGGFQELSQALCTEYLTARGRNKTFAEAPIFFDVSGAVLPEGVEDLPPTSEENCRRLALTMREIGFEHILFASDYPVFSRDAVERSLRESIGLSEQEIAAIYDNRGPFFEAPK